MPDLHLTCVLTGKPFLVTEWEQEHLKKFDAPLPKLCPEERHRRRLSHRNERRIYSSKCSKTGKPIISMYSPDKGFTILSPEIWWGDSWDARDYGRDYDFLRPFFEQFKDLQRVVPHLSLMNKNGENSEYCNITTDNKNCYLVFGGDYCEDCRYSLFSMHCKDTADVYWVNSSELTYDSVDCEHCYSVLYSQKSTGCVESQFLFDCRNCQNCTACVGLVGKKYYFKNVACTPEEYTKKVEQLHLDTWSGVEKMKKEFQQFKLQFPHRFAHIVNCENCTGDDLLGAKNCMNCFGASDGAEDLKDIFLTGWKVKDSLSSDHIGYGAELFYEMLGSISGTHCAFCMFAWASNETFYCEQVDSSHHLFGCSNMRRAEYCILNKQYSKEEYEALIPKIIAHMKSTGEWGEFFPAKDSKFAYNETVAQDYFPLSKEEVLSRGLRWQEEESRTITPNDVPDSIHAVTDDVVQKNLICQKTGRPFKIIPSELKFYKQMGIPVPQYAPETRHEDRIKLRNPLQLWSRNCAKCNKQIETSYSPDRPEIIYCETCYLATIY